MKKFLFSAVMFLVAGSAFADTVVAHKMSGYGAPLMSGAFTADVRKGTAGLTVMIQEWSDVDYTSSIEMRAVKSELPFTLNTAGEISFTTASGRTVVCANVVQKRFAGIKYKKVVNTGNCTFSTVLESTGNRTSVATLEMEIR